MRKSYLGLTGILVSTGLLLASCGGGGLSVSGQPIITPTVAAFSASQSASMIGAVSTSLTKNSKIGASVFANYYIYPLKLAPKTPSGLRVTSATISSPKEWAVDYSACTTGNANCALKISFDASKVTNANKLNPLLTINYSDNSYQNIPLVGQIGQSGMLNYNIASNIYLNGQGFATGTITLFNATRNSLAINTNALASNLSNLVAGATEQYTVNCDGNGSSVIAPYSACSIGYSYYVPTNITPELGTLANVQVVLLTTDQTTKIQTTNLLTTRVNRAPLVPAPVLNFAGNVVPLVNGIANILITNSGNKTLTGVSAIIPNGILATANTSSCNNLAVNAVCTVVVSANSTNTPNFGLTLQPSDQGANKLVVYVSGQTYGISSTSVDFGAYSSGASITRQVEISNLSATAITYSAQAPSMPFFAIDSGSTCQNAGTLAPFASCVANYLFVAPDTLGGQSSSANWTIASQRININLLATVSALSDWSNLTNTVQYADYGNISLSLEIDGTGNLYLGNSGAPGNQSSVKNIWEYNTANIWSEISSLWGASYVPSAPTSLVIPDDTSGHLYVGNYQGNIYQCTAVLCVSKYTNPDQTLGITSMVVNESAGVLSNSLAGYSNKTNGSVGQLLYFSDSGTGLIAGITTAVGKMDGGIINGVPTAFVPTQGNGLRSVQSTRATPAVITPSGLASGEFTTVANYDESSNTLYVGTSLANVYSAVITDPNNITTWQKLTSNSLVTGSYISDIGVVQSGGIINVVVGTANLNSGQVGGVLFVKTGAGNFTKALHYDDTSSVTSIATYNNKVYVATYKGSLWLKTFN